MTDCQKRSVGPVACLDTRFYPRGSLLRNCFEFLQKVFLGLMCSFSCVLWAIFWSFPLLLVFSASVLRQIARYLPHHTNGNASKTHPKSAHDKFKTVSKSASLKPPFRGRFGGAFLSIFSMQRCFPSVRRSLFLRQPASCVPFR